MWSKLTPLEEVMYQQWATRNEIEDGNPDNPYDYRNHWKRISAIPYDPRKVKDPAVPFPDIPDDPNEGKPKPGEKLASMVK